MQVKFDYRVLSGASAASLEEQVVDLSKDGYTPQGGVAIATTKSAFDLVQFVFSQAMIKVTEVRE